MIKNVLINETKLIDDCLLNCVYSFFIINIIYMLHIILFSLHNFMYLKYYFLTNLY